MVRPMNRSLAVVVGAFLLVACGGAPHDASSVDSPGTPASPSSTEPASAPTVSSATAPVAPTAAPSAAPAAPVATTSTDASKGPKVKLLPGSSIRFEGGDGTSKERAIKIVGAHSEGDGVPAEYEYLNVLYGKGKWKPGKQALLGDGGKNIDELDITDPSGQQISYFFDISDFFGKF